MKKEITFLTFIFLAITSVKINAQDCKPWQTESLQKTNISNHSAKFNINNISTWVYNNGKCDIGPDHNSGFEFPKQSDKTAIFQSGLLWGGKVNNEIRVGGSMYRSGLKGGRIQEDGTAEDIELNSVRIYKVRRDFKTADLSSEAADEEISVEQAYSNYEIDWNEWPAAFGAPFEDIDNNGVYNPSIDIPGVTGADQTLWYVANDLDSASTQIFSGSPPLGLEVQVTMWGYNSDNYLQNVLFKKYKLINKSNTGFTEMYICMWADADVGGAGDDYSGCDTLLNLGYSYNANDTDEVYENTPPAVGFQLLEGAKNELGENLPMTAFGHFVCGGPPFVEPWNGDYTNGTLRWYNWFQGLIGETGEPMPVPEELGGGYTRFTLSGDPLTGEGWVGGVGLSCGDTKFFMPSGPFTIRAGESQEITFAQFAAMGKDKLNAVRVFKYYANLLKDNFNDLSQFINYKEANKPVADNVITNKSGIQFSWSDVSNETLPEGYEFEGYNIYQFYSEEAFLENSIGLSTFDKINGVTSIEGTRMNETTGIPEIGVVQNGSDSGLQFSFMIEDDKVLNQNLVRGKEYYYGVTSYAYNAQTGEAIESKLEAINIIYDDGEDGPVYNQKIKAEVIDGNKGLKVITLVKNNMKLKQHDYLVSVEEINSELKWKLTDQTTTEVLLSGMDFYNYPVYGSGNIHPVVDGIEVQVYKLRPGVANEGNGIVEVQYAGETLPQEGWDESGSEFGGNTIWHDPNWEGFNSNRDRYYISTTFSGELNNLMFLGVDSVRNDYELRFSDKENNFGKIYYRDNKVLKVPFELWCIGPGTPDNKLDDYRMIPFISWGDYTYTNSIEWRHGIGNEKLFNYPASDIIYFVNPKDTSPGEQGYQTFANSCIQSGGAGSVYNYSFDIEPEAEDANADKSIMPLCRVLICDYDNDGNPPPTGTVIRFNMNKNVTINDKITFSSPTTGIPDVKSNELPQSYVLEQNYPNPFNPSTKIKFSLPEEGMVKLDIYNILGQKVTTLVNQQINAGVYEKEFNGNNLASGVYIYRLHVNNKFIATRKMVLLK